MKTLLLFVSLFSATRFGCAQVIRPALDEDPVFHKVLYTWIDYPRNAVLYSHVYGRVYAGFRIDEKGKLTDITILSPGNTKSGFDYEVTKALKHVPSLNPRYAGKYVLPVAFCFINKEQSQDVHYPVNRLDDNHLAGRILLKEYTNTINFASVKGAGAEAKEVWGYYAKN